MEIPITPEDPPPRECKCPPWVLRCAHFGYTLWLASPSPWPPHKHTVGYRFHFPELGIENCCAESRDFPDLRSAETEFERREQELIHASSPADAF